MARKAIKVYLKSAIEGGFKFIKRRFESLEELNGNFHAQRTWIFEKLEKKADFAFQFLFIFLQNFRGT